MEWLAKSDGAFCLSLSSEGRLRLREDDELYYQVQGELNITKRQLCYFVGQIYIIFITHQKVLMMSNFSLVSNRVPLWSYTERRAFLGPPDVSLATWLSQVCRLSFYLNWEKSDFHFLRKSGLITSICIELNYFSRRFKGKETLICEISV